MLKKIFITLLIVGFSGILIWGGVNRTLAKTSANEGQMAGNTSASRNQNGSEEHDYKNCDEDGQQGGISPEQVDAAARGMGAANGGRGKGGQGRSGGGTP